MIIYLFNPMKFTSIDDPFVRKEYFSQIKKLPQISELEIYKDSPETSEAIIERISDANMITLDIFPQIDSTILDASKNLTAIFCQSVGFNNIDVHYARKKGVRVYNCAGYNAIAVAEFVFALVTSLLRKIPAAQEHVRAGGWVQRYFEGRELYGKTIGIIGSGNIAKRILYIAKGYGMKTMVYTQHPTEDKLGDLGLEEFSPLESLLKKSDIVMTAVPLTNETKHLIGKTELALMKKDAILVNTSRQTVVDEYALAETILENKIGGAVLDVILTEPFHLKENPILIQEMINLPNVIVTPHIAGISEESSIYLGEIFVQNVKNFLKGDLTNCVNT